MTRCLVLDLCGGTGAWSRPYREAGYDVRVVDPWQPAATPRDHVGTVADFLTSRAFSEALYLRQEKGLPLGILAAPPCDHFSVSGARWWPDKDRDGRTRDAVDTVRDCLTIIGALRPSWWALENPIGRMRKLVPEVGPVRLTFDPCDFAGYPGGEADTYTKRTQLFGHFTAPTSRPLPITHVKGSSPIHRAAPGPMRKHFRAVTPTGFARAFFEANP